MALSTTVSALTRDKFMPVLVDNIFNSNVLCHKLLKNAELLDGGAQIVVPVEYAQNHGDNSGWLALGGLGDTGQTATDVAQKAVYQWATSYNSIVLSGEEQFVNAGASQVLSVLKARMSNAEKTIKDLFGVGMFSGTAVNHGITTLNGQGLVSSANFSAEDAGRGILEDVGTDTSVYHAGGNINDAICGYNRSLGGIDSDSLTWWDSTIGSFPLASGLRTAGEMVNATDTMSFSEFTATTNGVANGVKAMTRMYGHLTIDGDAPDLIVCSQEIFDAYESSLQGNKRFEGDATIADAGFQSLRFKGASVVVDSHCPAGQMYFLNTRYLDFKVHSKRNFAFEDFKAMEAKDGLQARIFWMGQLVCSAPRMQGLLISGPTTY